MSILKKYAEVAKWQTTSQSTPLSYARMTRMTHLGLIVPYLTSNEFS